jgi:hypothetical protein
MYSQLAGVLAGFSFSGIILIATIKPDRGARPGPPEATEDARSNSRPAAPGRFRGGTVIETKDAQRGSPFGLLSRVLGAAFLGLIVVSLSYASLSGTAHTTGSSISEEVILGPAFATSAIQVFYALVLMTESLDFPYLGERDIALPIRPIVARWATLLAVFFVFDSVRDYEDFRYNGKYTYITFFGAGFCALQLVVSSIFYPYWSGRRVPKRVKYQVAKWPQDKKDSTVRSLTSAAFILTVTAGLGYAAFDVFSDEGTMVWPIIPIMTMAATLGVMAATSYQLARSSERQTLHDPAEPCDALHPTDHTRPASLTGERLPGRIRVLGRKRRSLRR